MRKNKLLFLFFLLGLSVLSVAKEFIVPAQTVYNEEIIGLKQRIVVQGEANKDIVLLGGELILSGQARRDVVLIGADCTLKPRVSRVPASTTRTPLAAIIAIR